MEQISLRKILPYFVAVLVFIAISLIYFYPLLEGKSLRQEDIMRHKGMSKEIEDFRAKTGEDPLWTNSMFSGMPAYQISVKYNGNLIRFVDDILKLGLPHPANLVFLYMLGFFILLISMRINPWLCMLGAIAFAFSSYFFIILEAGHNSKAHAIAYMAPVLGGVLLTYRGRYIAGGLLTMLFLALEVHAGHPQITFYLFLLLIIFGITELISDLQRKRSKHFIKATAILAIASVLAVLTSITNLWATWEYGKYTIRGKTELSTEEENRTSGLDKDYATQWSYGIGESFSLMIPNIKGGGTGAIGESEYALSKVDPQYRQTVAGNANRYWGDQPFTSGPVYAGAIIFFLFVYGLFIVKGKLKWWLLAGTLLSIMLAWGKNFMPLTDLFLDYFPAYNKFRAVSMILVIAELTIPLLALTALHKLITDPKLFKEKIKISSYRINPLYIAFGLTGGVSLLFAAFPGMFFGFLSDMEIVSIAQQKNFNPEYAAQITDFYANVEIARKAILQADAFRSFVFILLGAAVLWGFGSGKMKTTYMISALAILILVDMWSVNKRYLNDDNFISGKKMENPYAKSSADEIILKDSDPNFRVLNLTADPFADASTSYFHKSIGGYHGAKLRRYQELYNHQIQENNMKVLNMLNTKYFIRADKDKKAVAIPNMQALGNAWFVQNIQWVENADEELDALTGFDPETTAVIDKRFQPLIGDFLPDYDSAALIKLSAYAPNKLEYQVNTSKDQLAVFSEIYYDKGWNAYIDDEKAPHFRADYVLRAMVLPAGKHHLVFRFEPKVFVTGEKISFSASLLIFLIIAGWVYLEIKKSGKK
ncbi:MAG: YfhO family protein, partial [Bacteroidales bacterium]|nr:YfhO family protein [Bacteroidales bacterium]